MSGGVPAARRQNGAAAGFGGATFRPRCPFAVAAASSTTTAYAASRLTEATPFRQDSLDSYVSLVATTPPFVATRTKCVLPPRPVLIKNLPVRATVTSCRLTNRTDDAVAVEGCHASCLRRRRGTACNTAVPAKRSYRRIAARLVQRAFASNAGS